MIELAGDVGMENQVITHIHYLEALRHTQLTFLSLPAIMQIVKADTSYRNIYLFIPNFLPIILEKKNEISALAMNKISCVVCCLLSCFLTKLGAIKRWCASSDYLHCVQVELSKWA